MYRRLFSFFLSIWLVFSPFSLHAGVYKNTLRTPKCITDNTVSASTWLNDGTLIIGGNFEYVSCDGGTTWQHTNYGIAKIKPDLTFDTAFLEIGTNGVISDFEVVNNTLYVGGKFDTFTDHNGTYHYYGIVALDLTTGNVDPSFLVFDGFNGAINLNQSIMDIEYYDDGGNQHLVLAGSFDSYQDHNGLHTGVRSIAIVDPLTGDLRSGWEGGVGVKEHPFYYQINSIEIVGTTVYAGGLFNDVISQLGTVTSTRNNAFAFDITKNPSTDPTWLLPWDPNTDTTIASIEYDAKNDRVFIGGTYTTVNGGSPVTHLTVVDPLTGVYNPTFTPVLNGGIYAMDMSGTELYLGGAFDSVDANITGRLALFDVSDPVPALLTTFTPKPNDSVEDLAAGPYLAVGGNFTELDGVSSDYLALLEPYRISGHLFEDVHYGGGPSRNYTDAMADGGLPLVGARVELYEHSLGDYIGSTVTDANGYYQFVVPNSILVSGSADIRVVASSITSSRTGSSAGTQPVLIYYRGVVGSDITNDVGGLNPNLDEFSQNLTNLNTANLNDATSTAQVLYEVDINGGLPEQMDFGFNFNTVVSTKDSGYGTLRNAISAANSLSNVGLAQQGKTAGIEHLNFMIPDGTGVSGTTLTDATGGNGYGLIMLIDKLPQITDQLVIDGDTNPFNAPTYKRIELDTVGSIDYGFEAVTSVTVEGIAFNRVGSGIRLLGQAGSSTIRGNYFNFNGAGVHTGGDQYHGVYCESDEACSNLMIGDPTLQERNYYTNVGTAIYFNANSTGTTIIGNNVNTTVFGGMGSVSDTGVNYAGNAYDQIIHSNVFANMSNVGIKVDSAIMSSSSIMDNRFGYDQFGTPGQLATGVLLTNALDVRIGDESASGTNYFLGANSIGINVTNATSVSIAGNQFGISEHGLLTDPASFYIMISQGDTIDIGTATSGGENYYGSVFNRVAELGTINNLTFVNNYLSFSPTGTVLGENSGGLGIVNMTNSQIGRSGDYGRNYFGKNNGNIPLNIQESDSSTIVNNWFGLELDGVTPVTGHHAVQIALSNNLVLGGVSTTHGNVFTKGVTLPQLTNSVIYGNKFCTDATGNTPTTASVNYCLGLSSATSVTIGGMTEDERNTVGIGVDGVGTGILLEDVYDVTVQRNSIGIGFDGVTTFPGHLGVTLGNLGSNATFSKVKNNHLAAAVSILLLGANSHHNDIEQNTINRDMAGTNIDVSTVPYHGIPQIPEFVPSGIALVWGAHDNVIKRNSIYNVPSMWGGNGAGIFVPNYANPFFPAFTPAKNNLFTENIFENNGFAIDIVSSTLLTWASGDGITPNDGHVSSSVPHQGMDYPVIKNSTINAGTMTVNGFIGAEYGDTDFAHANIEFYRVCNDGNQNGETLQGDGGSYPHGEPCEMLGFTNADANGNFTTSFAVGFANPSSVVAIAYDNDGNSSEVGAFFYASTTVTPPPPPPPAPTSTTVIQQSIGGLACHRTLTNLCEFNVMASTSLAQTPIIPVVPVVLSDESVVTSTPVSVNECRATHPCTDYLTAYLKLGQQNPTDQVTKLQRFLQQEGFYKGVINGQFTKELDTAVRSFQQKYADDILKPWGHSRPTGYVYIYTLKKINAMECAKQQAQEQKTCTPKPESVQACQPLLKTYIKFGAANNIDDVRRLQTFLNNELGTKLVVDGIYDGADLIAVRQFQKKYAIDVLVPWGIDNDTGYVYKTTQKKVNELNCRQ